MSIDSERDAPAEMALEVSPPEPTEVDRSTSALRRVQASLRRFWAAIILVALLATTGAVTAWLYRTQYLPDQQTNAVAAESAVKAASDGTVALLSYSPENLEADFTNARSHLTGDFLDYYNQFTEQIVSPAAKKNAVTTSASVVNAAVSELHPDRAVVLVFLNQSTTSTENPDGSFSTSAVKVGLQKVDDTWRIASFDPV